MDFDLSICICSWNTIEDLRRCLTALRDAADEARFEVIVVENNSEDGSGEMVTSEFPAVRLLQQYRNLGFTGGNNLAIQDRNGRHVLLLNSDAFVHPGAIGSLVAHLESTPSAGIIGPRLLNEDGSLQYSCRTFPNPVAALFRNTPLGSLFPRNRFTRDYLMSDWDHLTENSVDWVSGAALMIREEALAQVGALDKDYFMFCEDMDICWRVRQCGFEVVYFPDAVVTHKIGSSTSKAPNRMIFRFHRSMLLFFKKHQLRTVNPLFRPGAYLLAAAGLTARASYFLVRNQFDRLRRWVAR
ncbi:MAG: glycosyltransferase family 2 protein [Fimbriimonadaceae bacterium]|nr:glycosyltransferase family 2 protein [Fimbriimonadaceae bacterium]